MRFLPTRSCAPGMRLARAIFNEDGIVLLGAQVELTQNLIDRLLQYGIDFIYIEDKDTDDVRISDPITDETRIRSMNEIKNSFKGLTEVSNSKMVARNPIMARSFTRILEMIIDDLKGSDGTLMMLTNLNVMNNYLYQHSLNVTLYTIMLGIIHGYSKNDLMTLGIGCLLHDIGKTRIRQELLNKKGLLTPDEFKEIQTHTTHGFQILKNEPGIPLLSAHCALQHHERLDGSGYPRGIKGDEIHDYAKWIAICDSFDAMTTHRPHRYAMLPHQAMEVLYGCAGRLYDRQKVVLFRDNIAIYPLGITVKLNTGEKGVVVNINPNYPHRPVIRVLQDPDGQRPSDLYEIDLSQKLTIMIEQVEEA
jgi:HD-GYP domain-containing protein (c-di-GMP phosphodiesterase class II)